MTDFTKSWGGKVIDSLIIFSDSSLYDVRPVGGFKDFLGGEQSLV